MHVTAKNEAIRDFNNGIMQIETFGLRMSNSPYENYLAKHGIKMKTVAGCVVNERIVKHASVYNKEMKRRIRQKLGRDIFAEAQKTTQ